MSNDLVALKSWLDAYGRAWEERNSEAATALFAENGSYQVTRHATRPKLRDRRGLI